MTQRIRIVGAVVGLLLLGIFLSGCGSAPVAQSWPGLTLDGSTVTVEGDTVYVISGVPQKVHMVDAETGVQRGTFMPQGEYSGVFYWTPVTVAGDVAFVGYTGGGGGGGLLPFLGTPAKPRIGLFAFDPATGTELWYVPVEDLIIPAPAYADGVVYFGSTDGKVYAVDVETKGIKPGWPVEVESAIWATPLVDGGRIYLAAMDHHLYCLDAETGQEIWKTKIGAAMAEQPLLDDGILYVGAYDGGVHAVDANSGSLVEGFAFEAENWIWSQPLMVDGQLYVTSLDGKLYALDPASGAVLPPYPYDSGEIDDKKDVIRASPVLAAGNVAVATESGRVISVQNAQRQWVWPPSGVPAAAIYTTPVVMENTIYVVLMNGQVQTIDAESGVAGWAFIPPESN